MPLKEKLVECLQELKNVEYTNRTVARASDAKAEKALDLIFRVGRKRTNFTEGEKRQIGNLVLDGIKPIQINIVGTYYSDRSRLDTSVLMKRSAMQFLVESYADFPARSSTLGNELEQVNIKRSIEILDIIIETWRDLSDSDEGKTDPETAGAFDMPDSHIWWSP